MRIDRKEESTLNLYAEAQGKEKQHTLYYILRLKSFLDHHVNVAIYIYVIKL